MVKSILSVLQKEVRGLHEAAYVLAVFAIASQVLALLRDRIFTSQFGAGEVLDVYYAAFRIPDFIFVSVASLVSLSVLIPFLTEKLNSSKSEAREFINSIFSIFALVIISVSAVAFVFAPDILSRLFPGLVDAGKFSDLILITRIILLQPILLGFSSLLASVVHVYQRFILYAISPLLYNIGIIFGVLVLYPSYGSAGLGIGVVIGALLHLLIQIPFILKQGFLPKLSLGNRLKTIKKVMLLSLPRTLALSANQIALIMLFSFASLITAGSISVFNLSFNLQSVPLAIIGASYSVAAFPTLVRLYTNGDREAFFSHVTIAARHIIFWSIPAIVLFIVLRAQIVRVILGSGEFTWTDTRLTAASLAFFAISLLAQSLVLLFVRGYYAAGKTLKPLIINVFSSILVIVFAYILLRVFNSYDTFRYFIESLLRVEGIEGTGVLMLPLSYSLALIINASLFWILFQRDFSKFSATLSNTFFESLSAAVVMGFVVHQFLNIFDDIFDLNTFFGIFSQGFLSGIIGIAAGLIMLHLLGNIEIKEVWRSLHKKFWKTRVISSE